MKNYKFDFTSVSFKQAKKNISREEIKELIVVDEDQVFSIKCKKLIFLVLGLAMPAFMVISYTAGHKNMPESTLSRSVAVVVALMFIVYLLYSYYKRTSRFLAAAYRDFRYTSVKILYLSYLSGSIGRDEGDYWQTILLIGMAIVVFLILYYFVEKNMIYMSLNDKFHTHLTTKKTLNVLMRLSGVLIVVGIMLMQLYRLNRWW